MYTVCSFRMTCMSRCIHYIFTWCWLYIHLGFSVHLLRIHHIFTMHCYVFTKVVLYIWYILIIQNRRWSTANIPGTFLSKDFTFSISLTGNRNDFPSFSSSRPFWSWPVQVSCVAPPPPIVGRGMLGGVRTTMKKWHIPPHCWARNVYGGSDHYKNH